MDERQATWEQRVRDLVEFVRMNADCPTSELNQRLVGLLNAEREAHGALHAPESVLDRFGALPVWQRATVKSLVRGAPGGVERVKCLLISLLGCDDYQALALARHVRANAYRDGLPDVLADTARAYAGAIAASELIAQRLRAETERQVPPPPTIRRHSPHLPDLDD